MNTIEPGIYKHYKGKFYDVIGICRHTETLEELVVYKACYDTEYGRDSLWVRPFKMFTENIVLEGQTVPRFKKIND